MDKAGPRTNPLEPSRAEADWQAQGWAERSVPLTAAPRLETTISVRFEPDDALLLRRAARMSGVTKSEFVRRATIDAAKKKIDETPVPVAFRPVAGVPDRPLTRSRDLGSATDLAAGPAKTGTSGGRVVTTLA